MPQSLDPLDVERLLRRLPVTQAPESLWDGIQAALKAPEVARAVPPLKRPVPRWLMAAAAFLAIVTGEWLVTDAFSRAELSVGRIGTAEVGPNSRVQLDRGGLTQHRLTLEHGRLQVVISAPPRLFLVQTPSVLATDLGCAYTLEVDSAGASRLHVTAGWVELKQGDATSLVPAG